MHLTPSAQIDGRNIQEKTIKSKQTNLNTVITSKVKQSILKHTSVTSRQDEPVPIEPIRVLRIIPHDLIIQYVTHRSTAHGQARVTRISLLDRIDRQKSDRIDGFIHQRCFRLLQGFNGGGSNRHPRMRAAARRGHSRSGGGFDVGGSEREARERAMVCGGS